MKSSLAADEKTSPTREISAKYLLPPKVSKFPIIYFNFHKPNPFASSMHSHLLILTVTESLPHYLLLLETQVEVQMILFIAQ